MNDSERRSVSQCADNTADFIEYVQARDTPLSREEASWVAAAILAALPDLFSANKSLLQCLDNAASEFIAARKKER